MVCNAVRSTVLCGPDSHRLFTVLAFSGGCCVVVVIIIIAEKAIITITHPVVVETTENDRTRNMGKAYRSRDSSTSG